MKRVLFAASALVVVVLPMHYARAWYRGGGFGGFHDSFSGGWSHEGDAGGFAHGTAVGPNGVTHYGDAGGYAHGSDYGGYYHGTTVGADGTYHTSAYGDYYHQPTVSNYYGAGCYSCGGSGWGYPAGAALAGAAVGVAAGAAIANANANANAAAAYAAGAAAATPYYPIGTTYAVLPNGCTYSLVGGASYYRCPYGWFTPGYGANGVYYQAVVAP
jgi:hypothetical protein